MPHRAAGTPAIRWRSPSRPMQGSHGSASLCPVPLRGSIRLPLPARALPMRSAVKGLSGELERWVEWHRSRQRIRDPLQGDLRSSTVRMELSPSTSERRDPRATGRSRCTISPADCYGASKSRRTPAGIRSPQEISSQAPTSSRPARRGCC